MFKNFCPFIKEPCNTACVFHSNTVLNIATGDTTNCNLSAKISYINEFQREDLDDIATAIKVKR